MTKYRRIADRPVLAPDIREEPFRHQVRQIASMYGWAMQYHTHNSKFSDGGWPDEVYIHPLHSRIIFVELKTNTGRVKPKQKQWLAALHDCGLETALWRPRDIDTIISVLGPQQIKTQFTGSSTPLRAVRCR